MPLSNEKYSLIDHNRRFDTEQKCRDYLVMVRWQGMPECPNCGNISMNYYLTNQKKYKCSCCSRQFSVTQGTIFHKTKIPLTKWFLAIYLFTTKKRGISSVQMGKWLGVKQPTAWFVMHRLREALKDENEILLNGVVEVDETVVGPSIDRDTRLQRKRKEHYKEQERIHGIGEKKKRRLAGAPLKRGRKKGVTAEMQEQIKIEKLAKGKRVPFDISTIVFGMAEKRGKIVLKILGKTTDMNREKIYPIIKKHVKSDSTVVSDNHRVYDNLKSIFPKHQIVNHDNFYVVNGIHTNNIENVWLHFKKLINGTYFHLSRHHFDRYLNENTYRWNNRDQSEKLIFESFLPLIEGRMIQYKKLIQKDQTKLVA